MAVFSLTHSFKQTLRLIRTNQNAIARWISHLISPHIVGITLILVMAVQFSDNPLLVLLWLALILPLVVVPPLIYLVWLAHRGAIEDIYMPSREKRLRPLLVLMLWLIICLGLIRYWQAPPLVERFLVSTTILMGILGLITLFWKISFHGAAITAAATTTVMVAGSSAWPVMLLVPLVGWARVHLERHTPRQVIYGSLLGAFIALITVHWLLLEML